MGVEMICIKSASALKLLSVGFAVCAATVAPANAADVMSAHVGITPEDVGVMDRARPDYDAKGIPLGGFRLFPTLDLTSSYDDNVFKRPVSLDDYFFTISPAFRLESQWGRHFLEFYGGVNNYQYVTYTAENLTDWKVGGDGRVDISRAMIVGVNAYYGEFHELWSAPNNVSGYQAAPNRYYQAHTDVTAAYQPNRLGVGLGISYDRYDWQQTPMIGGGYLYNSDRNEGEYKGYAKVFYDFSPGYSGFVKASYDERDFDHFYDRSGLHRSSQGYRVDGGLDVQITHLLSGEVFAGYLQQNFSQNVAHPLSDVTGLDYGAQLDWYSSPVLTVHLNGKRDLTDVVINGASVSDDMSAALSADYEFRRNIILQGRVSYTNSRFVGTTRTDQNPGAGLSVKYLLNKYASANINYNYTRRTTNTTGFKYDDNMVSIGLALHI